MATRLAFSFLYLTRACPKVELARGLGAAWRDRQALARTVMATRRYSSEPGEGCRFNKSHEWASLDGKTVTVGISNYAQEKLGDVVYVELPEVGTVLNQGDELGVVESVKAASDLYTPMSGEVTEVNTQLQDEPDTINADPYGGGWIAKLEASDPSEYEQLLSPEDYKNLLEEIV